MSIARRGEPVTSTASSNDTVTRIVSPTPYVPPLAGRDDTDTPVADGVLAAGVSGCASSQSTLCAGSCDRPSCDRSASSSVAADRTEPPLASSVSASTAMPSVETFGSTTVWAKTSADVPPPLS